MLTVIEAGLFLFAKVAPSLENTISAPYELVVNYLLMALFARRLHDWGRTALLAVIHGVLLFIFNILTIFGMPDVLTGIPVVAVLVTGLIMFVIALFPSANGANRYGDIPNLVYYTR